MPLERINPPTLVETGGNYHHVVKDGNTVYLAGQVGCDKDGNLAGDAAGQIEQTFKNIQSALTFAGSDMRHIMKMTVYITHMEDFPTFATIRAKYIPDYMTHTPAGTFILVAGLASPAMRIELDIIASIP
jgi:enamine deaminase RidA (YjgF/YER057c/UK114 family)